MTRDERINLGLAPEEGPDLADSYEVIPFFIRGIFAIAFYGITLIALIASLL